MTDLTPLKTLLVNAIRDASVECSYADLHPWGDTQTVIWMSSGRNCEDVLIDADRLATAIHDHFLDREKVRAALICAFSGPGGDSEMLAECRADWTVDRFIASLAGDSQS
jgi:hypothetical protein